MKTSDFDYELPVELIAQYPTRARDKCKLLVYHKTSHEIEHRIFSDIVSYFKKGDVLVFNDTRVFPARLYGLKKETHAKLQILLLKKVSPFVWEALIKPAKRVKENTLIHIKKEQARVVQKKDEGLCLLEFQREFKYKDLERIGDIPLPPYIKRDISQAIDKKFYQTIYARQFGAVAAPTAGLHFTRGLMSQIKRKGIKIAYVTLHVSWGSFAPIRAEDVRDHKLHREYIILSEDNARIINERTGRLISIGTTVTRALESMARQGRVSPFEGEVDLYIYPSYQFQIIDGLLTNFHLPKTSLLLMVSAFLGGSVWRKLYQEAMERKYRFYSYGDAMLII
ncbi:MAG: tRNA preQ1(34) S-adenosylmethionine ribosyltransferase-isomerase QueA [Spirochaetes bacterium]|nr:tRNA preQ1(34) S-adenosylmethionine ribosyltransferase-isomerase QueA [Spirochaetota bacterium]